MQFFPKECILSVPRVDPISSSCNCIGYEDRLRGELSVGVEATGRPSDVGTGIAAKSAHIEQVQIGDLPGEYYTGILFQDEQGNVTWQPDDPTNIALGGWRQHLYPVLLFRKIPLTKGRPDALAESMTLEPVAK